MYVFSSGEMEEILFTTRARLFFVLEGKRRGGALRLFAKNKTNANFFASSSSRWRWNGAKISSSCFWIFLDLQVDLTWWLSSLSDKKLHFVYRYTSRENNKLLILSLSSSLLRALLLLGKIKDLSLSLTLSLKSERGKSEREGIRKKKGFFSARDLLSSPPPPRE